MSNLLNKFGMAIVAILMIVGFSAFKVAEKSKNISILKTERIIVFDALTGKYVDINPSEYNSANCLPGDNICSFTTDAEVGDNETLGQVPEVFDEHELSKYIGNMTQLGPNNSQYNP